jgi:hypothetical protein
MDMRRHLRRWLNDAELQRLGDRHEGTIASVTEEEIRNRFTATRQFEPVITFEDGWRVVPNISMRRALVEALGPETDSWIGRRIVVHRHAVDRTDEKTGTTKRRWQKRVYFPEQAVAVAPAREGADGLSHEDISW